jgi:hypothetical protein
MIPSWLHILSIAWLLFGALCAVVIVADLLRNPQHMWIMNVVWPVTTLFGTICVLWQYFAYGRRSKDREAHAHTECHPTIPHRARTPFAMAVGNGALHCGSGCSLGDICAEWLAFFVPGVAVSLGWQSLFATKMFAVWILDYIFAYAFGILFQYFSIAPMRRLPAKDSVIAAIKADTLSLTAWQIGMYGFMAVAYFGIFRSGFGVRLETDSVEFWFMMQIAMLCGFVTAYPVNWWLIRTGVKELM